MKRYRAIAEYYDAENEHQAMLHEDVPFFLGQLPRKPQSLLEIGVGTGRAAIPLAQAGHRVVGVDYAKDMLDIAQRKADAVGLSRKHLQLLRADAKRLNLGRKFDWICIFFNTFLAFVTLEEQDAVLAAAVRHLKPSGRFWVDIFQPNLTLLAQEESHDLAPTLCFVPRLGRTVLKTTSVKRDPAAQAQHVTFSYAWFDEFGAEHRDQTQFSMTFLFPRELRLLIERHGMEIEHLWGNYDGSRLDADSPRIIARCRRA